MKKVLVVEDYKNPANDENYLKGQVVYVVELELFDDVYVVYRDEWIDWIPKCICKIIKE